MKQQEILKKIGNILKELNEQYDYLKAEEMHQNDLELELFAANAKFLTDHTEIFRKINAQLSHVKLELPEHTNEDTAATYSAIAEEQETPEEAVFALPETTMLPMAESALEYNMNSSAETAESYTEAEPVEVHTPAEPTWQPAIEEQHEPEVSVAPSHTQDTYNFLRHEPEVSTEQHSFSLSSSHTEEEPAPPHVDLSAPAPTLFEAPATQEEEPAYTPQLAEPEEFTQPVNEVIEEPVVPVAVKEPEPVVEPDTLKPVDEEPVKTYTPPVAEARKPEPEHHLTLNERLSAQLNATKPVVTSNAQPVNDIKSAISLNDKMLFVKDLFNGYSLAYSEAIELLNRCKTFDEADRFLKSNYVAKNNWTDKPDTVDKFYAILHRRFTA